MNLIERWRQKILERERQRAAIYKEAWEERSRVVLAVASGVLLGVSAILENLKKEGLR